MLLLARIPPADYLTGRRGPKSVRLARQNHLGVSDLNITLEKAVCPGRNLMLYN